MFNRYITFFKPGMQFVVFLAILSMSFILGGLLVQQVTTSITGVSAEEMSSMTNMSPAIADKMKIMNAVLLAFVLLLPALIFSYLAFPSPMKYLGLQSYSKINVWLLAIVFLAISMPFSFLLEDWNSSFSVLQQFKAEDERISKMYLAMLQGNQLKDLILNTITICIAPAIIEEVFFRGCLQQLFANWLRKNQWIGILVVAIIFSAFHGQMSGFIPRLYLGLILGIVYHFTSNLWITMFLHFSNNFLTILMMYLFNAGYTKTNPMDLPSLNIMLTISSGIASIAIAYYFYTIRKPFVISEVEKEPLEIEQLFKND